VQLLVAPRRTPSLMAPRLYLTCVPGTVAAGETNRAVIARVLETAIVPDFVAKKNVKIQVNENENVQEQTSTGGWRRTAFGWDWVARG